MEARINHVTRVFLSCKTGLSGDSQVSRVMFIVCVCGAASAHVSLSLYYCVCYCNVIIE